MNTLQRMLSAPADSSTPPAIAAARSRPPPARQQGRPGGDRDLADPAEARRRALAVGLSVLAEPLHHRLAETDFERRAGQREPACWTGVRREASRSPRRAPADSAAPEPNTNGSSRGPRARPAPRCWRSAPRCRWRAAGRAAPPPGGRPCPARGNQPVQTLAAASAVVAPLALRIHEPTLIGEVTLNIRSMLRKRAGPAEVGDQQRPG